ncbi:MAG TPA: gamma-glutamyltransferase [Gemmatimonadaceae bacterium]|nr:gamma-glutamyltransferase [Gemmatimonadaceae bacterium]
MPLPLVCALLLQAAAPDTATVHAPRSPAFAPDGRLAISANGDLLVQATPGGAWVRVTSGPAWDRDPAWTRDGHALVFSSDRAGGFDLWRVSLSADGRAGEPERLTRDPQSESAPSVAPDGTIAFVRGYAGSARIWLRAPDGAERRLAKGDRVELAPAFSPDGARVAYLQAGERGSRLLVRGLTAKSDSVVNTGHAPEDLAWSPTGDRIAFSEGGNGGGVFVAAIDGRWVNQASTRAGDVAWSPDGRTLAIATYEEASPSYNGDPDRLGERVAAESFAPDERLYLVAAPSSPDAGLAVQTVAAPVDRATRNAAAYDRVWERSATLYFSTPEAADRLAEWKAVRDRHRAAALAATSDAELQRAIHAMLRERPPLREPATGRAAVSSAHPVATAAGVEILRAGGNVVDAAVAVSFALGVVEPDASGVGGYGEMVLKLASMERPTVIEFMTRVPEAASLDNASLLQNGRYPDDGPVLVNVPGTVAGMYTAWQKYGSEKIAWKDLLAPAIRAARDGYVVSDGLATTLATEREHFEKYEGSRALFFRDGEPLQAGDTLRNPDLAHVLEVIAEKGADGFYEGEIARRWVADLHGHGNAMTLTDLARYYAPEREAVAGTYRDYTIYSAAPPVSGGAGLVARLNSLELFPNPKPYTEDAATLHAALTAWQLEPSSRGRVADPGLWPVDIAPIVSKDTARARWACFDPGRALRPAELAGDALPCAAAKGGDVKASAATRDDDASDPPAPHPPALESPCGDDHAAEVGHCHSSGTTAFAVADADGNVVAVTQTLGTWGGNFYVTPGLGFLSNDKLTSYGTDPSRYGARLPFARNGSTLAPTIVVRDGKPVFAVSAAGNAWITAAVYETLLGAMDYGLGPQRALELPRFLPGRSVGSGADARFSIQLEDGFAPDVVRRLRELGYDLSFVSLRGELREGYGAAVAIHGDRVTAGADPRRSGAAGAVP